MNRVVGLLRAVVAVVVLLTAPTAVIAMRVIDQPSAAPLTSSSPEPVRLTTAAYRGGRWNGSQSSGVITASRAEDGVRFTAKLPSSQLYRLDVDPIAGPQKFELRLKLGTHGGYRYLPAPTVPTTYLADGGSIEILFYRASPAQAAAFALHRITVTSCPACLTTPELRSRLLGEVPGLRSALVRGDHFAAAVALMHWSAPRVPFTWRASQMIDAYGERSAVDELQFYYLTRTKGGDCGPNSALLLSLIQLFGLRGFLVDYGDRSWLTDVVMVMPVKVGRRVALRVFSPVFDQVWTSASTGQPIDLLQALRLVRRGDPAAISASQGDLGNRWVLNQSSGHAVQCRHLSRDRQGCGLNGFMDGGFAKQFRAHGLSPTVAGWVQLMSRTQWFAPAAHGIPPSVMAAYLRLRVTPRAMRGGA